MSYNLVTTGDVVKAADVNQFTNGLQRAAGQTETGKYILNGWTNAANDVIGQYMQSLSKGSTPVSVTIDTADFAPNGVNTPTTTNLTSNGFFVKATATGASTSCYVGGNFTIQY